MERLAPKYRPHPPLRQREDLSYYATSANVGSRLELTTISTSLAEAIVCDPKGPAASGATRSITELVSALGSLIEADTAAMLRGMREAESLANGGSVTFALARHGGTEATITFQLLGEHSR